MAGHRIFLAITASLVLSGCQQLTDRTFGDTVPINLDDDTPPSVELIVPDEYLVREYTPDGARTVESDLRATITTGLYARAGKLSNPTSTRTVHQLAYTVVANDPDGVRAVIASNIPVTPWCAREPSGSAPSPPEPRPATVYFVDGDRTERSRLAESATTRLPLRHEFAVQLGEESDRCPEDRPVLFGVVIELQGAALNFNTGPLVQTQSAIIEIGLAGRAASSGWNPGPIWVACNLDPDAPPSDLCDDD